ncbi:MAG: DNA ligase D [Acidobacteria bacterium]|nr:DNA ligase D [Acidobacteriota bacterium]
MPLEEYARKRRFPQTPEPAPTVPAEESGLFCVQRHHARRLHYDLRLEIGGTLKSWAVPNGPTLDPAVKQLAVHVEDHPVEYATFEGNIPKGNYGGGSMMLWDAGTFEVVTDVPAADQLARGDFKFRLHGEKLSGDFGLVRMKDRQTGGDSKDWLLLKKKDEHVQSPYDVEQHDWSVKTGRTQEEIALDVTPRPQVPMPNSLPPMLAQLTEDVPSGSGWLYEIKWDGVRAMALVENGQVRATGRKGNDITRQYPEIERLRVRARSAIIDGEICVLDEQGRPSFERIQPRIMASGSSSIQQMTRTRPAVFFAFDLLYLDGRDLRGLPLESRKKLLASVLVPGDGVKLSEYFTDHGAELLQLVRQQGLEGIMAKRAASFYEPARSRDWLKIKAISEQEFVLAGFTKGERDYFGALLLGVWDNGRLHFAGSVGTGFDRRLMHRLHTMLSERVVPTSPFAEPVKLPQPVTWTRPELVATVKFLEWTAEGRLRAPVFVGLRDDIAPAECVRRVTKAMPRPELIPPGKEETPVTIDGQTFRIKNLSKLYYPADQVTKRDILNYYDAVAELLLPHWQDRPLSLRRYPDGIDGEAFFQKNAEGLPDWIRTTTIRDGEEAAVRVVGDSRAQLVYLAQLGCIDQNPWMSRLETLECPDFLLIDLDPQECNYDLIVEAAHYLRRKLELFGLAGYPKTTGGDGMHLYVPLEPIYTYDQTKAFAEILARLAAAERPELFTTPRAVAKRQSNRVYFDYLQNGRGKTISAPYVLRAHPGAPVATPLDWGEVKAGLRPQQFHLRNAMERFDRVGDLFAPVLRHRQYLEEAFEAMSVTIEALRSSQRP